jgi:hypothetical protein
LYSLCAMPNSNRNLEFGQLQLLEIPNSTGHTRWRSIKKSLRKWICLYTVFTRSRILHDFHLIIQIKFLKQAQANANGFSITSPSLLSLYQPISFIILSCKNFFTISRIFYTQHT